MCPLNATPHGHGTDENLDSAYFVFGHQNILSYDVTLLMPTQVHTTYPHTSYRKDVCCKTPFELSGVRRAFFAAWSYSCARAPVDAVGASIGRRPTELSTVRMYTAPYSCSSVASLNVLCRVCVCVLLLRSLACIKWADNPTLSWFDVHIICIFDIPGEHQT